MCEKTVSKKQCYSVVIAPKKPWVFRGILRTLFISTVFLMGMELFLTGFFSVFHQLQIVTLRSLVIKGKNALFWKINFTKMYWVLTKNKNVTCVIGWFFIILFSFPLSFIYTSFTSTGSCNFTTAKNLKWQQGLNLYKTSQIAHFIHHSKGNITLFQNICCKSILKKCHWINLQLEFKKVHSSAQKFLGNLNNILGVRVNDTNQTFFWLLPIPHFIWVFRENSREFHLCFNWPWNFPKQKTAKKNNSKNKNNKKIKTKNEKLRKKRDLLQMTFVTLKMHLSVK